MAITAAITLSSATSTAPNGQVTATVTITNGNSTTATVTGFDPYVSPTGVTTRATAVSCGLPPMGPGQVLTVAGSSGTLAKNFGVQAFAPQQGGPTPGNPTSEVYDVGCIVYTNATGSDAVVAATTTTLTVSAPSHSNL